MTSQKRPLPKPRSTSSARKSPAKVTRPNAAWSDLVLPAAQSKILQQMIGQAKTAGTTRTGGSVVFAGDDAAGQMLAANLVASALGRPLRHVDLAAIARSYPGETEKNLRRLFDAAAGSGAILFFDEADALFGKRTDVKDSHDRFANTDTAYLLQRIEASPSPTILATHRKSSLDPAFLRRIRYVVAFPTRRPRPRKLSSGKA